MCAVPLTILPPTPLTIVNRKEKSIHARRFAQKVLNDPVLKAEYGKKARARHNISAYTAALSENMLNAG